MYIDLDLSDRHGHEYIVMLYGHKYMGMVMA